MSGIPCRNWPRAGTGSAFGNSLMKPNGFASAARSEASVITIRSSDHTESNSSASASCVSSTISLTVIRSRRLGRYSASFIFGPPRDRMPCEGTSRRNGMATVRQGRSQVLLVVDMQVGVMAECADAAAVVAKAARAVERARAARVPVVWVQHASGELPTGSPQWQWAPELVPAPAEPLIHKNFNSAFEETSLEKELAALGAAHIVLAGAQTNWCIRATAYGALERGYDVTLLKDAHSTGTIELGGGARILAADVVRELNVAMTWLGYPGRKNAAVAVEDFDFTGAPVS